MYISLDWVNELVGIKNLKLNDLMDKLTLGGFEVEEILEIEKKNKKQIVLDISATANRADSLSIKGMAKEMKALLDQPETISKYSTTQYSITKNLEKVLLDNKHSAHYSTFLAVTVENLTNLTVPNWIKEKLSDSGVDPLNNFLDFQNFILLETGYPFEFYDLNKIINQVKKTDFNLTLKTAQKNTIFKTTNDLTYQLGENILILEAENYPISIAGITVNKEVETDPLTTSLLIEGSIYTAKTIRQESRVLGLRTDRSARYEKGINDSHLNKALERLLYLLKLSNPDLICKIHTTSKVKEEKIPKIRLKYKNIVEILGPILINNTKQLTNLSSTQISHYLTRLNFTFSYDQNKNLWDVEVPLIRKGDIEREIDLIEEIGRLHGFNNFVTNLPNIERIGNEDFSYQTRKKITNCLLNEGFNELIQYSLVNEEASNAITLINPLLTDCSTLRTSLLPSLLETTSENLKQTNSCLEGFEYGHVFQQSSNQIYIEQENIAGIFGGLPLKTQWNQLPMQLSWFEAKGKMEDIFSKLNIQVYWKKPTTTNSTIFLHPYRTAELVLDNNIPLGVFGQIHPILSKTKNLSSALFLFELNLAVLKAQIEKTKLPIYKTYSTYPKIVKDLSFIVDQTISFEQIKNTIIENAPKVLIDFKLLDEYRGTSIPKNQTSLCIQLIFQSNEKTLVTKDIENIISNIQTVLVKEYNILVRN